VHEISTQSRSPFLRFASFSLVSTAFIAFFAISISTLLLGKFDLCISLNLCVHGTFCAVNAVSISCQCTVVRCRLKELGEKVSDTASRILIVAVVSVFALAVNTGWAVAAFVTRDQIEEFSNFALILSSWLTSEALPTAILMQLTRTKENSGIPSKYLATASSLTTTQLNGGTTPEMSPRNGSQGLGWPMPLRVHVSQKKISL